MMYLMMKCRCVGTAHRLIFRQQNYKIPLSPFSRGESLLYSRFLLSPPLKRYTCFVNIAIDSEGVVIEKANSLPEAIALFGMREGKTAIIAGGTDLLPKLKNGEIAPEVLVDLSSLDELKTIADAGERIEIGALVTDAMIEKNPIIAAHLPALAAASER